MTSLMCGRIYLVGKADRTLLNVCIRRQSTQTGSSQLI